MTTAAVTNVDEIPPLSHDESARLSSAEYDRFLELLRSLAPDEWGLKTPDCPAWTVRDLATHVLGAAEATASLRENLRQVARARRRPEPLPDAITATQVEERAKVSPAGIVSRLEAVAPRGVERRRRTPRPLRSLVRLKVPMPWGTEQWKLGYVLDTVYLRDSWMHRIDVSRATGRDLVLTAEHDGRIVADVVAEWARRHRQPFRLVLGGQPGGAFLQGSEGEELRLDAVEFCRILSGRSKGTGLLSTEVPF